MPCRRIRIRAVSTKSSSISRASYAGNIPRPPEQACLAARAGVALRARQAFVVRVLSRAYSSLALSLVRRPAQTFRQTSWGDSIPTCCKAYFLKLLSKPGLKIRSMSNSSLHIFIFGPFSAFRRQSCKYVLIFSILKSYMMCVLLHPPISVN